MRKVIQFKESVGNILMLLSDISNTIKKVIQSWWKANIEIKKKQPTLYLKKVERDVEAGKLQKIIVKRSHS